MKILVTGGTGFIGSHIAKFLAFSHGAISDPEVTITGTKTENKVKNVKMLHCHLDGMHMSEHFNVVIHQGANNDTTDLDEYEMNRANVAGPMALFQKMAANGCKQFVYASSTAVYGDSPAPYVENETKINPLNPYAESKAQFDVWASKFALDNELNVIGLRYCNVFGPGEGHKNKRSSMIYQLCVDALRVADNNIGRGTPLWMPELFKSGEQKRDWIYVGDVLNANLKAMNYQGSGIFNCGTGVATTFNDIVKIIAKFLNLAVQTKYIDNPYEDAFQNYTECDMTLAKEKLGFNPALSVENGVYELLTELAPANIKIHC